VNLRRWLRWPYLSLAGNATLFIIVVTADFYGWISGPVTFLGLVVCAVWLFLNHALPRSWYGWFKYVARSMGWDGLLETELIHDAAAARMAGRWEKACPALEQAALVAARRGDGPKAMSFLTDAAMGYLIIDDFENSKRCRDAAAGLAGHLNIENAMRSIRFVDGLRAWYSGDWIEAKRLLEDYATREARTDPLRAGIAVMALAQVDSDEGRHADGLARLTALERSMAQQLASPRFSTLGQILTRTGRLKNARIALERGRSLRPLAHRTANNLAEDSLVFALLDLAEGNSEPAHQALAATAERHSHEIRMLQGDLLTALGGIEQQKGSSERARQLFNTALMAFEGIAPAKAASLRHHLGEPEDVPAEDPLALYYAWPPPVVDESTSPFLSNPVAPLPDRRSRRRVSPNSIASVGTAAVTLIFFLPLGWQAALGLLLLLAIHEFGHYFGARLVGVPARTPIFLGLLGAATIIDRKTEDVRRDAIVTLAGPAAGLAVAVVCLIAAIAAPTPWHTILVALARGGFILNILQLLPILPLDGGHVAHGLHRGVLIAGLLLQVALLVFIFQNPDKGVTAIAFLAATIGSTLWVLTREEKPRAHAPGRGLVASAYAVIVAIAAGGLIAGFVVPFRTPTQIVASQIIGDGFNATLPAGWTAGPVCCDEVMRLIHDDPNGSRTDIDVLDLRGSGFGLADQFASSPTAIAQSHLAAALRRTDAQTLTPVTPLDIPGMEGAMFTYTCSCQGGYKGEEWISDVVIVGHGDRMLSFTLGTYAHEYAGDHESLDYLLSGWSWQ